MPPLCKGRWLAWQDGGVVKVIFFYKTIPHPPPSGAPFTQGSLFCSPIIYQFFLTSTAFVDTNAKYGTPLSRYAVFLKIVLWSEALFELPLFCMCLIYYNCLPAGEIVKFGDIMFHKFILFTSGAVACVKCGCM